MVALAVIVLRRLAEKEVIHALQLQLLWNLRSLKHTSDVPDSAILVVRNIEAGEYSSLWRA